jgi:DNA-binding NarL/FixJ family response regulator
MAKRTSRKVKRKKSQLPTLQTELLHSPNGIAESACLTPAASNRLSGKLPKITAAEQRVLALVARARSNKEIASDLGISPATVKRHMEKILKKLKVRNRVEAAICGLILNGCPHGSSSGCLLRKFQAGADSTDG